MPATIPGYATEIRYERPGRHAGKYYHPFAPTNRVRMIANADGSVTLRGRAKIHATEDEPGFWQKYGHRSNPRRRPLYRSIPGTCPRCSGGVLMRRPEGSGPLFKCADCGRALEPRMSQGPLLYRRNPRKKWSTPRRAGYRVATGRDEGMNWLLIFLGVGIVLWANHPRANQGIVVGDDQYAGGPGGLGTSDVIRDYQAQADALALQPSSSGETVADWFRGSLLSFGLGPLV